MHEWFVDMDCIVMVFLSVYLPDRTKSERNKEALTDSWRSISYGAFVELQKFSKNHNVNILRETGTTLARGRLLGIP